MPKELLKILIIEDSSEQARLMEVILHRDENPFHVEIVHDATTGLKRLKENRYHAVVLDYSLPTLNGLQALAEIKKSKINLPVIMVTGQGDERIAVEAMRQGAYDYIVKAKDYLGLLPRVLVRAVEEQQLSSKLQLSEKRYSALFDKAGVAIIIIDAETYLLLQVNEMAIQLFGMQAEKLLQRTFLHLCSSKSHEEAQAAIEEIKRKGSANFDHLILVGSGQRMLPTDISGSLVEIGESTVIQLFVRDISEKIKMQRQLLLSRQRLVSLFDGITDLISVQDKNHTLIMGNEKYAKSISQSKTSLVGEKCYKTLFGRSEPCVNCPAPETYKSGLSKSIEIFHQGRAFHIWTFPMSGLDGKPEFIVEYAKDVTEQKEIEKQLIKSEKLATIGLLSSGIAHELRNPLNIIETARYSIEDVLAHKDPEIDRKLEIIKKNIRRASIIIDNLLHFSRHSNFEKERIDVENLINTTLSLLEKEISVRKVNCEKVFQSIPKVFFSLDSLKQVFLNIILNGVEAMPQGGQLKISTAVAADKKWVCIDFADSGIGISEENLKHIFTPFFSTKGDTGGIGLGLYLSYSIIKREGGDLYVKSRENVGTTFTVKLPIAVSTDTPI
jgi:PAS domain S-box-containing protein